MLEVTFLGYILLAGAFSLALSFKACVQANLQDSQTSGISGLFVLCMGGLDTQRSSHNMVITVSGDVAGVLIETICVWLRDDLFHFFTAMQKYIFSYLFALLSVGIYSVITN